MAGTVVADTLQAASTSTLVLKNGVANTPPTVQDSAGTQIGTFCRAWVNFDGTGTFSPNPSTTKIRASFNVSSITDNATGDYTVNFTNALPDANYAVSLAANGTGTTDPIAWIAGNSSPTTMTTSALRIYTGSSAVGNIIDANNVHVKIHR